MAPRKKPATKRAPAKRASAKKSAPAKRAAPRKKSVDRKIYEAVGRVPLTVIFKPETLDWLEREGDSLGLDAPTFVRFLVEERRRFSVQAPLYAPAPHHHDDYREIDAPSPADTPRAPLDLDELADAADAFPPALPGDMNAVRSVGQRARRDEVTPSFRRK